ncbi:Cd(II)/Pb(II)-responsive transcriptional regulator [Motiliproteus coralliicola]|uniref:Cd(II)/Pb(II)-responsive transcriptional regulator n=1 Tax=Motiliproteus coralliicola TaxID=2283196 RepID=A0A369W9E4_9GAMM|nr:Cd(II)/Pb(II)-responsive transcriptional regulator [Motiliproteus coralliicola]RDE18287.1 Cd(II)/Pb(II)-responsive transcriptional regulator [Motiliproteus coralliicola]
MRIGELARQTGTETVTIRFYEKQGLMPPPARSDSNYRIYNDTHKERLLFIRHCRGMDISLEEIATLLECREHPAMSCDNVNRMIDSHISQVLQQINDLQRLEQQLRQLRQRCNNERNPMGQAADCGILDSLEHCEPDGCHNHQRHKETNS